LRPDSGGRAARQQAGSIAGAVNYNGPAGNGTPPSGACFPTTIDKPSADLAGKAPIAGDSATNDEGPKSMKRAPVTFWIVLLLWIVSGLAPAAAEDVRHEIHFPDLPGYQTLACDLHTHTVFSDGQVWPPVRVAEAWRQGLDALAITDHIEYQPHKDDVPTNHNRPYELAVGASNAHGLLFPRGAEITRDTPPGHFNAIFLTDVNPLDTEELLDAVREANQQGAFVFWNHQGWKGAEAGRWLDVHTTLLENGWLHGMEVCNNKTYFPDAHRWCLERNLTMLGTSDAHEPDRREKSTSSDHRTLTLVFVSQWTLEGLKEALTEGRTVVWFEEQLIGRREYLEPLFERSVEVVPPVRQAGRNAWLQIRNLCDADVQLERTGNAGPEQLTLPARTTTLVKIATGGQSESVELKYVATNFIIAPDEGLPVVLKTPAR